MTGASDAKLIAEPPLLVLPTLAAAVGLNQAIVLQQIHYRTRDGEEWRASAAELRNDFPFWSEDTILRVLGDLRAAKLVKRRQAGTDRAGRYRIDYAALAARHPDLAGMHGGKLRAESGDPSRQGAAVLPLSRKRNSNGRGGDAPATGKYGNVARRPVS